MGGQCQPGFGADGMPDVTCACTVRSWPLVFSHACMGPRCPKSVMLQCPCAQLPCIDFCSFTKAVFLHFLASAGRLDVGRYLKSKQAGPAAAEFAACITDVNGIEEGSMVLRKVGP